MTTRNIVLRQAAEEAWSDLTSGRFDDVDDESMDDFIAQLSVRAAAAATQLAGSGRSPAPGRGDPEQPWE